MAGRRRACAKADEGLKNEGVKWRCEEKDDLGIADTVAKLVEELPNLRFLDVSTPILQNAPCHTSHVTPSLSPVSRHRIEHFPHSFHLSHQS